MPDNLAIAYSWLLYPPAGNAAAPGPTTSLVSGPQLGLTAVHSQVFSGSFTYAGHQYPYGSFSTYGFASLDAGRRLRAYSSVSGTVPAGDTVIADAGAVYNDVLAISGPYTPGSVRVDFELHGMGSGAQDALGWSTSDSLARLQWSTAFETVTIEQHADGIEHITARSSVIPWSQFTGNQIVFGFTLSVLNRVRVGSADAAVNSIMDYSGTGVIRSVSVFDTSGTDISSAMSVTFATVPEPPSLIAGALLVLPYCLEDSLRRCVRRRPAA